MSQRTTDAETVEPPEQILELSTVFFASRALRVAVEVELFEELARAGGATRAAVAERVGFADCRGLQDVLDVLVAHGLLTRDGEVYEPTTLSERYLRPESDLYVGDFVQFATGSPYESALGLRRALETDRPQNGVGLDETLYDGTDVYEDPESRAAFQDAMASVSAWPTTWLAKSVDWDAFDTVCDLGAAKGVLVRRIAEAADCDTVGFDLPGARPGFESYTADSDASDRIEFRAGDFFEDPLPSADAYVFGHVLNDWERDEKRTLLERTHESLPDDGAVFVHEAMLDGDRRHNRFGLYSNVLIQVELNGGYCATVDEYESLLSEAGFERVERREIPGAETLLIGRR